MHINSLLRIWWMVACLLLLVACGKNDDPDPVPDPDPVVPDPPAKGTMADHTVLIYVVGDNNLGRDGFATSDLREMEEAIKTMDTNLYTHNNLLVFYDQYSETQRPKLYRLVKKGDLQVSATDPGKKELVISVEQELLKEYTMEVTSTDTSILKEVIGEAFDTFPARSYGFVYWSHGEGWLPVKYASLALRSASPVRWMGVDWNDNSANSSSSFKTSIPELAEALRTAPAKLDFLMFDACFMMSVEVAYELKDCADFIIASPTETPGPGAPYTQVVPAMFGTSQGAVRVGETYFKYYESTFNPDVTNTNANWTGGVSMTVLDTSKLDKLAAVTKANLTTLSPDAQTLRKEVFDYDKRNGGHVGYYDMEGLMEKVLATAKLDEWKAAYHDALTYWNTTSQNYSSSANMFSMTGANGVTHYIPSGDASSVKDESYRTTAWYEAAGLSKLGW